jgi:hypothetical protein
MSEGPTHRVVLEEKVYKFDVAFSFLAKDERLATQINDLLQDRVKTFLYSRQQEHLAGTDGEKTFSAVFGEDARIVAVLYRNGWGQTPWTRIEETAIRGRAYEEGYDFTLFIPLDQAPTVPRWLPKTQIWFNFERWGSAGAAAIIEQKAQERGGQVREESVLDRAARLGRAIEYENRRRTYLGSSEGVQAAQVELTALCDEIESLSTNEAVRALKIVHKRDMLHTVLLTENNSLGLDVSWPLRF